MKCEYDHLAANYAVSRPAHVPQVFEEIQRRTGPAAGRVAIDVGAGTGLFTIGLARSGWDVIAADASRSMLSLIPESSGRILRVCAAAECLPVGDGAVDLVTAAQSFHWFNPPYALAEFARVLRAGGWLVLVWYRREVRGQRFVEDLETLMAEFNPKYRGEFARQDWAGKIDASGLFGPVSQVDFPHEWQISEETLVSYGRSLSYIRNVVPRADMPRFEDRLRVLARGHFDTGPCRIPLHTEIWLARRV